ncbi:MAG: RNA methyltransferase [Phycisphaerae bacterium]|nr:RNA methyltransferase [Phycisphaerae bacterium]
MPVIPIESLEDPRVADYGNLKDRELAAEGDRFMAEGEFVASRFLQSGLPVESVLVDARRVERIAALAPAGTPVYVVAEAVMTGVVGYKFHTGVLAVGHRPAGATLQGLLRSPPPPGATYLVCPKITNTDNLGSLVRTAAALGAEGVILGPECCDPYWRRCIRVSMGAIFHLPLIQLRDVITDLGHLREAWSLHLVAAALDDRAQPLATTARPPHTHPLGIVLGNEAEGLPADLLEICDDRIFIPMHRQTDSLNVAMAAAVFLYHFTCQGQP